MEIKVFYATLPMLEKKIQDTKIKFALVNILAKTNLMQCHKNKSTTQCLKKNVKWSKLLVVETTNEVDFKQAFSVECCNNLMIR